MINEINTFFFRRCQNELLRSQISPDTSIIYENHTQGEREDTNHLSEAHELSKMSWNSNPVLLVSPVLTLLDVSAVGSDFLEIFEVFNQLLRHKETSVRHYITCNQCLFKKRPKVGLKLVPGIYVRIYEEHREMVILWHTKLGCFPNLSVWLLKD